MIIVYWSLKLFYSRNSTFKCFLIKKHLYNCIWCVIKDLVITLSEGDKNWEKGVRAHIYEPFNMYQVVLRNWIKVFNPHSDAAWFLKMREAKAQTSFFVDSHTPKNWWKPGLDSRAHAYNQWLSWLCKWRYS